MNLENFQEVHNILSDFPLVTKSLHWHHQNDCLDICHSTMNKNVIKSPKLWMKPSQKERALLGGSEWRFRKSEQMGHRSHCLGSLADSTNMARIG